jgi:hypothetical protein
MGIYSLGFLLQPASAVLSFLKRVHRMSGAEADVERIMSCKVLLSHKHTGNLYGEGIRLIAYIFIDDEKSSIEQAVRVVLDQENQSLLLGHLTKEDAGYVKQRIIGFLQPPRRVRLAANWPRGVFKYILTVVAKVE